MEWIYVRVNKGLYGDTLLVVYWSTAVTIAPVLREQGPYKALRQKLLPTESII